MDKKKYAVFKKNIPEIPSILGREEYINYVVFVPFLFIDGQYHLLFQKRAANISQAGEICFPGGEFDSSKDKDYEETAIRETVEELGIDEAKIIVEGRLGVVATTAKFIIEVFTGLLDLDDLNELDINKNEVEEVIVLPVSYFINNKPLEVTIKLEIHPSLADDKNNENLMQLFKEFSFLKTSLKPWDGGSQKISAYKRSECLIWGLTAEIINEIVRLSQK